MADSWPLPDAVVDRVAGYVSGAAARQYVRYFRVKLLVRVAYLGVLLTFLVAAIWPKDVSTAALIIADIVVVAVAIVVRQSVVIYTVRMFAQSLDLPMRQGWSIPLFRPQRLVDWLADHADERVR